MQGSPLDEMVQLFQSDWIQSPLHEIFGLRRVTYSSIEEIPSLLADSRSQHLSSSQMPSSDLSPLGVNVDLEEGNAEDDHTETLNETSEILLDQEEDPDFIPRMELPEAVRHSDDEKQAATIIQRAYRMVLLQRRSRNQTGSEGNWQNLFYFHLCWKKVREENRKSDKYTQAFLGPLPHLLSSLDSAEFLTLAKKREMKKKFVHAKDETLDEVSSNLNRISYALDPIS